MSAFISRGGGRVDPTASPASPRTSRKASFEGDGDVKAAAVKTSVTAKLKAASYRCGGKTPRERLSKLFGKFVRKTGERGATGFTYPQMSAVLRGVCKLKDQEFDLLWQ